MSDTSQIRLTSDYASIKVDHFLGDEAIRRGYRHFVGGSWQSAARDIPDSLTLFASAAKEALGDEVVSEVFGIELEDALGRVTFEEGMCFVSVRGLNRASARAGFEVIRAALPREEDGADGKVAVTFWTDGRYMPDDVTRRLDAAPWETASVNYSGKTRVELASLIHGIRPGVGGRFLLLHGEPGTGKTSAIKTLAHEWRDWCDVQYITDPDAFFGASSSYMQTVLNRTARKWRLLVIEDAAELVRIDAAQEYRQGFARLLNAVDGLIGQGLNILVLITTNEEIGKLHPALTRAGRCAAVVEFEAFTPEGASAWLRAHDLPDEEVAGRMTLAELYAATTGARRPEKSRPIGFAAVV